MKTTETETKGTETNMTRLDSGRRSRACSASIRLIREAAEEGDAEAMALVTEMDAAK